MACSSDSESDIVVASPARSSSTRPTEVVLVSSATSSSTRPTLLSQNVRLARPRATPSTALLAHICLALEYYNEELNLLAMIYLFNGQINFQSSGGSSSGWHGTYMFGGNDSLDLNFNCRGAAHREHNTFLLRMTGGWVGFDYRQRTITLIIRATFRRNPQHGTWSLDMES